MGSSIEKDLDELTGTGLSMSKLFETEMGWSMGKVFVTGSACIGWSIGNVEENVFG